MSEQADWDIYKDGVVPSGPGGRAGGDTGDCAGPELIHLHCRPCGGI